MVLYPANLIRSIALAVSRNSESANETNGAPAHLRFNGIESFPFRDPVVHRAVYFPNTIVSIS